MKKIIALCLIMVVICGVCGCGDNTSEESPSYICNYSNLVSEESQNEADKVLEAAGISDERRKVLFYHINQFNEVVDSSLLCSGFEKGDALSKNYDPYDYQDQWMAKYPDFDGYNCRITAFTLFGDMINVDENAEIRDADLFMDIQSLESDKSALIDKGDKKKFRQIYSIVPTENTKDVAVHYGKIMEDWSKRGISFKESDKLSLITVWFHNQWSEEENELSIGHVGTLATCEKGYMFIEKVAFQEPYQATYFDKKEDVADYLLAKYDVEWGQETSKPFILENDKLISE